MNTRNEALLHLACAASVGVLGAVLCIGASTMPNEVGYGGVGPNFLPALVGIGLLITSGFLAWQGWCLLTGAPGAEAAASPSEAPADWPAFAWVSVGLLANAALITSLGFILSCTLCFVFAARGFRVSKALARGPAQTAQDAFTGVALSAPVFWLFTKALQVNLPSLSQSGWI